MNPSGGLVLDAYQQLCVRLDVKDEGITGKKLKFRNT